MRKAIIAGTGLENIIDKNFRTYKTLYGEVLAAEDGLMVYILRHGAGHVRAPHCISYKANAALLEKLEVSKVITAHAVGSITERLLPGEIGIVADFIDMTHGRDSTFYDGIARELVHTAMDDVFDEELKLSIIRASRGMGYAVNRNLTYITTNGPRFESPAEIRAYRSWGADVVGMTLNPEVNLIHELGLPLASLSFSINWASGIEESCMSFIDEEEKEKLAEAVLEIALKALDT